MTLFMVLGLEEEVGGLTELAAFIWCSNATATIFAVFTPGMVESVKNVAGTVGIAKAVANAMASWLCSFRHGMGDMNARYALHHQL